MATMMAKATGIGAKESAATTATTSAAASKQQQEQQQRFREVCLSSSYYPLVFSERDTDWRDVIEQSAELQLRHLPKRLKGLGSTEEFMRVEH
jgi:hypothetical protein